MDAHLAVSFQANTSDVHAQGDWPVQINSGRRGSASRLHFGTGYSNLSYLIDFPFRKLKIDKSFVARLEEDASTGAVVSTIVGLSRALGVHTVAEGVETETQATLLKAAGCDVVQGYLFGRPAPLMFEVPGEQPKRVANYR